MWDLHHREWLLSSLEARAAASRQRSNLYLSAGLSVYINCDSEIQTSFSTARCAWAHKKSYFHYSPKINSNLESAGRWPSSNTFVTKLNAQVTQHTQDNISGDFGIFIAGSLCVRFPSHVRSPDVYCCLPLFTWSGGEWGFVTSCVVLAQSTRAGRGKRPLAARSAPDPIIIRLNVFNRNVQQGGALCFLFRASQRKTSPWVRI